MVDGVCRSNEQDAYGFKREEIGEEEEIGLLDRL
jgi:hypothetical protein